LTSVGSPAVVVGPNRIEVAEDPGESLRLEVELYLRVWRVLYPDAEVELAA
jgi:hypothetical protein